MSFDVIFTDASTGTAALDFVDIDPDLAGQAAGMRSRGNRLAMLGSCNLAQLRRHGKRRGARLRLIRRQRLFFRLPLGADCSLKCKPCSVLPGNMFDRAASRAAYLRLRWHRTLQ